MVTAPAWITVGLGYAAVATVGLGVGYMAADIAMSDNPGYTAGQHAGNLTVGAATGGVGTAAGRGLFAAGRSAWMGMAAKSGMALADEMAVLRQAATGKSNFGLGSASHADAMRLGNAWVGNGSRLASDGRTLVSADGLRTFRPPSPKPNSSYAATGVQANFETLERVTINGVQRLKVIRNGHPDITP